LVSYGKVFKQIFYLLYYCFIIKDLYYIYYILVRIKIIIK